jgi:methylated-DNA-[protein]-cysteine S-methyltransferase
MSSQRTYTAIDTPLGELTLVAEDGRLCGVYFEDQRHLPPLPAFGRPSSEGFGPLCEQLGAYFSGDLTDFDVVTTAVGTPFQLRVWAALGEIPYGQTRTYGEIACRIGQPGASRAVGLANGRNPIGIIVPCHRVVGANGSLTGYGGGLERKRALLELEGVRGLPLPGLVV